MVPIQNLEVMDIYLRHGLELEPFKTRRLEYRGGCPPFISLVAVLSRVLAVLTRELAV